MSRLYETWAAFGSHIGSGADATVSAGDGVFTQASLGESTMTRLPASGLLPCDPFPVFPPQAATSRKHSGKCAIVGAAVERIFILVGRASNRLGDKVP